MDEKLKKELSIINEYLENEEYENAKSLANKLAEARIDNPRLSLYRYFAYDEIKSLDELTKKINNTSLECLKNKMLVKALEDIASEKENEFSEDEINEIEKALENHVEYAMMQWKHADFTFYKTDSIYQAARCLSLLKGDEDILFEYAKRAMSYYKESGIGNTLMYHNFGKLLDSKGLIEDFEFYDLNNAYLDCIFQYTLNKYQNNEELYKRIQESFGPELSKKFFNTFAINLLSYVGAKVDIYWFNNPEGDNLTVAADQRMICNLESSIDIKSLACYNDYLELKEFVKKISEASTGFSFDGGIKQKSRDERLIAYLDLMRTNTSDSEAIKVFKEKLSEGNPKKYDEALAELYRKRKEKKVQ